jgi:membrane dipeptidase
MTTSIAERISRLLVKAPVVDGHNDLAWALRNRVRYDLDAMDLASDQSATGLHTDIGRLRRGGVGAQFWSVFVPTSLAGGSAVTATLEQIDAVHTIVQRYPADLVLARTADEVVEAWSGGRVASLLGMEGGHSIDCSLGTLRMMYALGVRYLTLTHGSNTPWADSATDEPRVGGLSAFGREVVRECNRLGVMVDLSHVADTTMRAALDTSTAPAFFSHSSARALCGHPRNVPDDVLARVRDTAGIVMVTFVPGFLNEECRVWMDGLVAEQQLLTGRLGEETADYRRGEQAWLRANPRPPCGIGDVADHLDHVREVAGIDSVGLGGDFDGIPATPDGLPGVDGYPALLAELAVRGWSDADLAKLTWHNALRVLRDTETVARSTTDGPSLATFAGLDLAGLDRVRPDHARTDRARLDRARLDRARLDLAEPELGGLDLEDPDLDPDASLAPDGIGAPYDPEAFAQFDLDVIADALSQQPYGEIRHYLDPATGELTVHTLGETANEDLVYINPLPSHEWYQDMADFADLVTDGRARSLLMVALNGKGAFRRFKDVVLDDPRLGPMWNQFSQVRGRRRAAGWLADVGLVDLDQADAYEREHPDPPVS